ncbi:MAG TPA: helix-turn-helix transcriptional regulator [Candidatus Aquilonibacter sp.]|nr:helix-turn-helix transcriptional regulator [Candidatus Aquilonibacter sp.]
MTRESLVIRRATPVVLFLDGHAELRAVSVSGCELWERYGEMLRSMLDRDEERLQLDGAIAGITDDGSYAVRIAVLSDGAGYAVLFEPFSARDPLGDIAERYALTPRECDVARLLTAGANTDEIATRLSIARSTAIIHVKNVLAKTGTRSRAAAVGRILHRDADGA